MLLFLDLRFDPMFIIHGLIGRTGVSSPQLATFAGNMYLHALSPNTRRISLRGTTTLLAHHTRDDAKFDYYLFTNFSLFLLVVSNS